jgi:alanyl-tRNA synthetase
MTAREIRQKYIQFFKDRGHVEIAPAKLVLENDLTTLFTSSGMQPLVPYLLGEKHPEGVRLVDSQPSFRAEDIEEVGDNRHDSFFEMLGNWSLGDYFKQEQISWLYEFLTSEEYLGLDKERLHFTVFEGNEFVEKDTESIQLWKSFGVADAHIHEYGATKNWWSRSGTPDKMPVGEIGGPDSEVFYDFGEDYKFHENSAWKSEECHVNCDCGRFVEIGNSVFIQFKKVGDGEFEPLKQQNVDFGGGLERMAAANINNPDIFMTDLYQPIIKVIEELTNGEVDYGTVNEEYRLKMRIIADHIKAAVFLIRDGVVPSNKMQGYLLRRLLRRAALKMDALQSGKMEELSKLVDSVVQVYDGVYSFVDISPEKIKQIISEEIGRFQKTLKQGMKEIEKIEQFDGKVVFDLYQSYGFPPELTEELLREKGLDFDKEAFQLEFKKHQEASRSASAGAFKGGLAGHSEVEIKYHTITHLLHQALRDVLGESVYQKGSNITSERLRFDFSFDRKMTEEEVKKTEEIINERITQNLQVDHMIIPIEEARAKNAIGLFDDKYAKEVSVYAIGPNFSYDPNAQDKRERGGYYSMEFCGGPHVERTSKIGKVVIQKEEAVAAGIRRIRAVVID